MFGMAILQVWHASTETCQTLFILYTLYLILYTYSTTTLTALPLSKSRTMYAPALRPRRLP